jgi:hypothetical protein
MRYNDASARNTSSAQTHTTKFNASVVLVENPLDSFNQSCTDAAIT